MIDISVNVTGLDGVKAALDRMASDVNVPINWLMRDQLRLLCADLLKQSPPKTPQAGKKTVSNDAAKLFFTVSAEDKVFKMKKPMRGFVGVRLASGAFFLLEPDNDMRKASDANIVEHWNKYRNNKGRVRRQVPRHEGNYTVSAQFLTRRAALNKAVRTKLSHVGRGKASLLPALDQIQSLNGTATPAPAWVRKAARPDDGSFAQRSTSISSGGYAAARSLIPYAKSIFGGFLPSLQKKRQLAVDQLTLASNSSARLRQVIERYQKSINAGAAA